MMNVIDISNHQAGLDLNKITCDGVIMKATEGVGFVDKYCNAFYQQAKASGKLRGLYHFASGGDAIAEADFFVDNVSGYVKDAILILDFEGEAINRGVDWAKRWLDRVRLKTGVKPLIYTSVSVVAMFDWSKVAKDYGLWIAGYYKGFEIMSWNQNAPIIGNTGAWGNATMYQYTSTGRVVGWSGNLDLNVFYGDKNAWDKLASGTDEKDVNAVIKKKSGNDSQKIYLERFGDYFRLKNKSNKMYLSTKNNPPKKDSQLVWRKNGDEDSRLWKLEDFNDGEARYIRIMPKLDSSMRVCIEKNGIGGDKVKLWSEGNGKKETFWITRTDDGFYVLCHTYSTGCISC